MKQYLVVARGFHGRLFRRFNPGVLHAGETLVFSKHFLKNASTVRLSTTTSAYIQFSHCYKLQEPYLFGL